MRKKGVVNKSEPRLCSFNCIELKIPRLRLIKLAWTPRLLNYEDYIFLKVLSYKAEAAENKILHVQSLVRKALLKSHRKN